MKPPVRKAGPIATYAMMMSRVSLLSSMRLINSLSFGLRGLAS
jgi:hypothetical protein